MRESRKTPITINSPISSKWQQADEALHNLLDEVQADHRAHVTMVTIAKNSYASYQDLGARLAAARLAPGTQWSYLTGRDPDGNLIAMALPVSQLATASDAVQFPSVMAHTWLVAWWLCTAWRVRELARAARTLMLSAERISAAAVARPLLETTASFWVDGARIHGAWATAKMANKKPPDRQGFDVWTPLIEIGRAALYGGRFKPTREEERYLKRAPYRQVMDDLDELVGALGPSGPDLSSAYQWLCNTVHPSMGNLRVFQAPDLMHSTGTYVLTPLGAMPLQIEGPDGVARETTVEEAVTHALEVSLQVLTMCLDSSLRAIDDLGLTTHAGEITAWNYWRALKRPDRNASCPCRSGRKAKACIHRWGEAPPPYVDLSQLGPPLVEGAQAPD